VASLFTHAITGATVGLAADRNLRRRPGFWVAIVLASILPDIDVIGFSLGIQYGDLWGHRGMTHSLLFAAIASVCLTFCIDTGHAASPPRAGERARLALLLFAVVASHGVLDAMTNGGLGVAFFSPFDPTRYFFFWRPIRVSPIGTTIFFSRRGWLVLQSELLWVWFPALTLAGCICGTRALRGRALET